MAQEETAFNPEAQQTEEEAAPLYRSIYAELFGASNLFGISYNDRIKPGSPFVGRHGIRPPLFPYLSLGYTLPNK